MEFEIVKLSDLVINMHQGINTVADKVQYQKVGVPIIQSKHITSGFLDLDDTKFVTNERYNFYKEKYNPKRGEILLCNIGTIGKSILVEEDNAFLIAWNLFLIKLDNDRIIPKYANQYFNHLNKINYYNKFLTGGTVKFINKKTMSEIPFLLPPISDQIRISEILSQAENLITQRKESILLLDELLKSTFWEMFGTTTTNSIEMNEVKMISLCLNSKDIKCGPFGTQLNKGEFKKEGVELWGIPQINSNFKILPKDFVTEDKANELEQYSLVPGDIAMSRKGNVGKCCIFPKKYERGIMHSDILRIRVDYKIVNPLFLLYQLKFSKKIENQIASISKGAVMAGINVGKLKNILIQNPPLDLQNQFATIVEKVETLKAEYQASLKELENMYGVLSQKAFKGELKVKEYTNNEVLGMVAETKGGY